MGHSRPSLVPMDFEWENKQGPVDQHSPFIRNVPVQPVNKRPHSVLETPSKGAPSIFNTPNRPQLREPNSQHVLFSQQVKPLPAVPPHVHAWEPRTPASTFDFSSGGETPNTPAQESDFATPDAQIAGKMGRLMNGEERSKSPKKSPSKWTAFKQRLMSPSPEKPEKPEKDSRKYYSTKVENRVMKRRSKTRKAASRDECDSDDGRQALALPTAGTQLVPGQPGYAAQAGDFFTWIEAHPNLPSVLSYWMQFAVNGILGLCFFYGIYTVWAGVQADVSIQASRYEHEILREIALCNKDYISNRCDPATRVPAMEHACGEWESCMNRDPRKIAKASVTAKTFAMIFNSFVEEFSYKSMLFMALVIFGGFHLSNWAFGVLRRKDQQHQHLVHSQQPQPHQQSSDFYPPATPHRNASGGGYIDQQGYYTPFTSHVTKQLGANRYASQSIPALLPAPEEREDRDSVEGARERETRRTPRKRGLFA